MRCRTKAGVRLLRSWFLRPSRDLKLIRNRQAAIESGIYTPAPAYALYMPTRCNTCRHFADGSLTFPFFFFPFLGILPRR